MKQNMFLGSSIFNIAKVAMILALLLFNTKTFEPARPPLDVMKSKLGKTEVSSVSSKDRAPVQTSATNPCTYIPGPDTGDSGCHKP